MLPRLQAEERLTFLNLITAGGSVQIAEPAYRSFVRDLERDAGVSRRAVKASLADLAAMGITVETPDQEPS